MAFGLLSSNVEVITALSTGFNAAKLMKARGCFSGGLPRKSRRKNLGRQLLIAGEGLCLSTAVASHFLSLQRNEQQQQTVAQTLQATKVFDMTVLPTWQLVPLWLAVLFNVLFQAVQPDAQSRATDSDLSRRVENMEQDLEDSVAILRALTKQVEKLSVRVHTTRRSMQDQVEQMSKLVESTSEALGVRGNLLEQEVKELGEALENMQEQQARQVELISRLVENNKKIGSSRRSMQTQEPKTEIKDDYKYDFWLS